MKVMLIDMGSRNNWTGGQSRVVRMLYDGLRKNRMQTYYLGYETMYMKGRARDVILKRKGMGLAARKSRVSEIRIARMAYNLVYVSGLRGLGMSREEMLRKAKRIGPDVIIANAISDFPLLKYLRKGGLSFKAVYIDHGSASTTTKSYFSKEGIPLSMGTGRPSMSIEGKRREFFSFFDMNVALNDRQYHEISRRTPRVMLIPNGARIKPYKDASTEKLLRKRLGIRSDNFVVIYVGRLFDRQKNVSALIKAFLETRNQEFRLLIVGDGPSMQMYRELASEDGRIAFSGILSDKELNSVYNMSDLFVLPSFWEGFALTVLEAAAHSLPMIISKGAYVSDLNADGESPVPSFNEKDHYELAELIEKVYSDKDLYDRLGRSSLMISKKFTEKRIILHNKFLNVSD